MIAGQQYAPYLVRGSVILARHKQDERWYLLGTHHRVLGVGANPQDAVTNAAKRFQRDMRDAAYLVAESQTLGFCDLCGCRWAEGNQQGLARHDACDRMNATLG